VDNDNQKHQRKIRSFVKRVGRRTVGQDRALNDLLPEFGIDHQGILDFEALFSRKADTILEIGFGMGQSLLAQATSHPENNYLGIEVHTPVLYCARSYHKYCNNMSYLFVLFDNFIN